MKKIIKNEKGNSLVELIMVMALLILFGVTIYTIIYSGAEAQNKIIENKDAQTDARIALSYVNVKLRQNDSSGRVSIETFPETGENAIVLKGVDYSGDVPLDTWIFYDDNALYEYNGLSGEEPEKSLSLPVIESDGLVYSVEYDEESNSIKNTITYEYGGESKTISSLIHLRSSTEGVSNITGNSDEAGEGDLITIE